MNKSDVTKLFKVVKTGVSKHSPEILTGIGIAGMVTTVVLAVKSTPKAIQIIEEEEKKKEEKLTKTEVIKTTWKCYIPAATTGLTSIACLIGASSVNLRRNAAIATAYKLSETALTEYREKVAETIGEKKEQAVRDQVAKDKVDKNPVTKTEVIVTPKGDTLCYDAISGRYFKSDIDKVKRAVNELNNKMLSEMYISLNEFYDELGLASCGIGDEVGWNLDSGLIDVHFSSQIADDDTPCIVIEYEVAPRYDYSKLL